jgi:hypothetical protein
MPDINYLNLLDHSNLTIWKDFLQFTQHIDLSRVIVHIDPEIRPYRINTNVKAVIVSTGYVETPRFDDLVQWCVKNPDVKFILLGDMNIYDFVLPANLKFLEYRFFHIELAQMIKLSKNQIPVIDYKKIKYKFSSLSFMKRQHRALLTAYLLTNAKEQSLISWHNYDNDNTGIHDYLINSVKNHSDYKHFDWDFLNKKIVVDDFNYDKNVNLDYGNTYNSAYTESLINFNNETFWFSYYQDDNVQYQRPGPYITEKTWRCLLSGSIMINTGQPFMISFLKEKYHLDINYSFIDSTYDNIIGDFDRFSAILNLLDKLLDIDIEEIWSHNIKQCTTIQQLLLDPDYIEQFNQFNLQQDIKLISLINE